jgi:hypothetical protein
LLNTIKRIATDFLKVLRSNTFKKSVGWGLSEKCRKKLP